MRRLLFLLLFAMPVFAQGVPYENFLMTANGPQGSLIPVSFATITICAGQHAEVPCTPAVPIYSDVALTQVITPPLTSGPLGNYRFVVAPGTYSISFTGPGISTPNDIIVLPLTNNTSISPSSINGYIYVDGVKYPTLNAAVTAACGSQAGNVTIPPGSYSFSTQIVPSFPCIIQGAGASYQNVTSHCTTTLTWTGGAAAPFLLSGTGVQGSKLKGFCLNATGTAPPVFVDIDSSAGDTEVSVVIDTPTVQATVAALRWGNTSGVVNSKCSSSFVRAAAPTGYAILQTNALWLGVNCRSLQNTTNEWTVGTAGGVGALDVYCYGCAIDVASGNIGVSLIRTIGFHYQGYFECGGTSTGYCIQAPNTASQVADATFDHTYFSGPFVTGATALVDSEFSGAQIAVTNSSINGTYPNPNYIFLNNAGQNLVASNNTSAASGTSAFSASNSNGVVSFGNVFSGNPATAILGEGIFQDSAGFKQLTAAGCATAASLAATCTTTVTWTTAFADASYKVTCGGRLITSGVPLNGGVTSQIASAVIFQTVSATAAAAQFTNIDCIAVHQ